jgi:hypothetical protein
VEAWCLSLSLTLARATKKEGRGVARSALRSATRRAGAYCADAEDAAQPRPLVLVLATACMVAGASGSDGARWLSEVGDA